MEAFLLRKNDNFVLELVISGLRKSKGQIIWIQKVIKGLWKKGTSRKEFFMLSGVINLRLDLIR